PGLLEDFRKDSRGGSGELECGFVSFELGDDFVLCDCFARRFAPRPDLDLADRFADRRDFELDGHGIFLCRAARIAFLSCNTAASRSFRIKVATVLSYSPSATHFSTEKAPFCLPRATCRVVSVYLIPHDRLLPNGPVNGSARLLARLCSPRRQPLQLLVPFVSGTSRFASANGRREPAEHQSEDQNGEGADMVSA